MGSVTLADKIDLKHPITNGPGLKSKTIEDLRALIAAGVSMPVIGSITAEARVGNPEPRFWFDEDGSTLNAPNLPNGGLEYYEPRLPEMVAMCDDAGVPLCVNIAEFSEDGYLRVAEATKKAGVALIEFNLSCPNAHDNQGGIICFDFKLTQTILRGAHRLLGGDPYSVKVSPYSDLAQRKEAALLLRDEGVPIVTLCNTFPDAFALDKYFQPVITKAARGGLAGFAGKGFRPIVQGHVFQFRQWLKPEQEIIAIGGISKGRHALEYEVLGGKVFELTSAHHIQGPEVFLRVKDEYEFLKEVEEEVKIRR